MCQDKKIISGISFNDLCNVGPSSTNELYVGFVKYTSTYTRHFRDLKGISEPNLRDVKCIRYSAGAISFTDKGENV